MTTDALKPVAWDHNGYPIFKSNPKTMSEILARQAKAKGLCYD